MRHIYDRRVPEKSNYGAKTETWLYNLNVNLFAWYIRPSTLIHSPKYTFQCWNTSIVQIAWWLVLVIISEASKTLLFSICRNRVPSHRQSIRRQFHRHIVPRNRCHSTYNTFCKTLQTEGEVNTRHELLNNWPNNIILSLFVVLHYLCNTFDEICGQNLGSKEFDGRNFGCYVRSWPRG